jgi:hypothetical protein
MKKTVFWMHGPFVRGFFARGSSEKDRVLMREKTNRPKIERNAANNR